MVYTSVHPATLESATFRGGQIRPYQAVPFPLEIPESITITNIQIHMHTYKTVTCKLEHFSTQTAAQKHFM